MSSTIRPRHLLVDAVIHAAHDQTHSGAARMGKSARGAVLCRVGSDKNSTRKHFALNEPRVYKDYRDDVHALPREFVYTQVMGLDPGQGSR